MCNKNEENNSSESDQEGLVLPTELIIKGQEAVTVEELAMADINLEFTECYVTDVIRF